MFVEEFDVMLPDRRLRRPIRALSSFRPQPSGLRSSNRTSTLPFDFMAIVAAVMQPAMPAPYYDYVSLFQLQSS